LSSISLFRSSAIFSVAFSAVIGVYSAIASVPDSCPQWGSIPHKYIKFCALSAHEEDGKQRTILSLSNQGRRCHDVDLRASVRSTQRVNAIQWRHIAFREITASREQRDTQGQTDRQTDGRMITDQDVDSVVNSCTYDDIAECNKTKPTVSTTRAFYTSFDTVV